ncbi:MAG TPA: SH3 domain-containing protein [Thermomicrobiales bacterium]|nr:SH3 domain-containing protein [Thermomicrobiales bacterium]
MKFTIPSLARRFLPVVEPAPAFAGPGGTMLFASSGSGDGGYEEGDAPESDAQSTRRAPGAPRGPSGGDGGSGGGRQRTVDFQPEERYWTEYLRIALPIIGLLLMIGLFWYWASQLANGDDPDDPVATNTPGSTIIITPESTPEPTEEEVIAPPTEAPEPTDEPESTPDPADEEEPTEEPEDTGEVFEPLQTVVVVESVNLREDATSESASLGVLEVDTVLEIQDGPFPADDGYTWWEVVVSDTNQVGYVAEDFIAPTD